MNSDSNVDDLSTEMASASLDDGGTDPEQLLFKPPLDSKAYKSLDDIPRYLYRVFVPSSDAKTDSIWVRSKSVLQGRSSSTKDIFDYENQQSIAYQLNMHLRWRRNGYAENNFVSWTSSLLFAIQYIYYRRFKDHDKPSLNDIELHVIDTTSFPTGTFMHDLDLMDFFGEYDYDRHPHYYPPNYNLPNLRTFRNEHLEGYYFGEYLSQGSLKIESNFQMITANVLFDNDRLHRLQPAFAALYRDPEDGVPKWADAVIDLRKAIWPQTTRLLSSAEINRRLQAVKEIVDNSAPSYRFPLGIYLAALTGTESTTEDQGTADDNVIFQFFRLGTWDGRLRATLTPRRRHVY
ncbi:hypothetical protein N7448_010091 [Penicillium atrosanguineum]|nr:hypothetical protein N7448_010091 [Penicillium atrosanguineum]